MERIETRVIEAVRTIWRARPDCMTNRTVAFEGKEYEVVGEKRFTVRLASSSQEPPNEGKPPLFEDVEPWPDPVETSQLLDEVSKKIREYVVISSEANLAVSLWVFLTFVVDVLPICPLLILASALTRSGKTTLVGVLGRLCNRAITTNNISPAVLYRIVEAIKPTLLMDEIDTLFGRKSEQAETLRGLMNAGHDRTSSRVYRCQKDSLEVESFDTFGPKVLSGIGSVPETLQDRGIIIKMKRRTAQEESKPFSVLESQEEFQVLRRKLTRWGIDHSKDFVGLRPSDVPGLDARALDNWAPLLAIANLAGWKWLGDARAAAHALSEQRSDASSTKIQLLRDIRRVFNDSFESELQTALLIERLIKLEDGRWRTYYYKQDKPLDANGLAHMLHDFEIHPKNIRFGIKVAKGYKREQFVDAWVRNLPRTEADDLMDKYAAHDPQHPTDPPRDGPDRPPDEAASAAVIKEPAPDTPETGGEIDPRSLE